VFIGPLDSWNTLAYLDIFLTLDLPNEARRTYEHSKLYYALNSRHDFSEERVVTFRIPYLSEPQRLRVKLPENLRSSSSVKFRLDPAPGSHCHCVIHRICIAEREDQADLTTAADLDCLKERTRRAVYESEVIQRAECPHHPESLNLEITARCNLTCTHCSSHGTKELHTAHNTMPEFRRDLLQKLAAEVFPSLTSVLLWAGVSRWQLLIPCGWSWSIAAYGIAYFSPAPQMLPIWTGGFMLPSSLGSIA
jgi:hypothetical protein